MDRNTAFRREGTSLLAPSPAGPSQPLALRWIGGAVAAAVAGSLLVIPTAQAQEIAQTHVNTIETLVQFPDTIALPGKDSFAFCANGGWRHVDSTLTARMQDQGHPTQLWAWEEFAAYTQKAPREDCAAPERPTPIAPFDSLTPGDKFGFHHDRWILGPKGEKIWLSAEAGTEYALKTKTGYRKVDYYADIAPREQRATPALSSLVAEAALHKVDVTTASPVQTTSTTTEALKAVTADTSISVPRANVGTASITGTSTDESGATTTTTLGISVPSGSSAGTRVGDDALIATSGTSSSQLINVTGVDASTPVLQMLVKVENAAAPSSYRWKLNLPAGTRLRLTDENAVEVVNSQDKVLAAAPPAWFRNADGSDVGAGSATYRLEGTDTLILDLDLSKVQIFPATADPALAVALGAVINALHWIIRKCGYGNSFSAAWDIIINKKPVRARLGTYLRDCVNRNIPFYMRKYVNLA